MADAFDNYKRQQFYVHMPARETINGDRPPAITVTNQDGQTLSTHPLATGDDSVDDALQTIAHEMYKALGDYRAAVRAYREKQLESVARLSELSRGL
jgi:hypothetical protein